VGIPAFIENTAGDLSCNKGGQMGHSVRVQYIQGKKFNNSGNKRMTQHCGMFA
jgi:hypothetical protein